MVVVLNDEEKDTSREKKGSNNWETKDVLSGYSLQWRINYPVITFRVPFHFFDWPTMGCLS